MLTEYWYVLLGFFHTQVDEQHSVDPDLRGIACQPLESVSHQRIQIAEENQWKFRMAANLARDVENPGRPHASVQRSVRGPLDDGAVGYRIGEGNTQFDNIRAAAFERRNQRRCPVRRRIASRD